jgi:hypothetical protein
MRRKASELKLGDTFRLHIYGQVVAVGPVAGGKRVKIRIALEDQGQRRNCGAFGKGTKRELEFTDDAHIVEFLCLPGRAFQLIEWLGDDDDDQDETEPLPPLVGSRVG